MEYPRESEKKRDNRTKVPCSKGKRKKRNEYTQHNSATPRYTSSNSRRLGESLGMWVGMTNSRSIKQGQTTLSKSRRKGTDARNVSGSNTSTVMEWNGMEWNNSMGQQVIRKYSIAMGISKAWE